MTNLLKLTWMLAVSVALAVKGLPEAWQEGASGDGMTSATNRLVGLTEHMRPICVGRFVIDVPESAEVIYGPARLPVEIWRREGEGVDFDLAVGRAVAESETRRWLGYGPPAEKGSLVGKVMDGFTNNQKIVFGVGRADGAYYNVQSLIKLGDDLYIQEYQAFGEGHKYQKALTDATEIARRLRRRADEEIPSEPGICLDGAFLHEPHRYMVEAVSLGIRLKEFEDVRVSIEMTKKEIRIESDALEPRLKAAERDAIASGKGAWYDRIRILRKGTRRVGSWDGYEVGARIPAQKEGEEHHEFAYLSQGEPKNPLLPVLDIQMQSGVKGNVIGRVKPSINDEEALYLWEKFLGSIRPRTVRASMHESGQ
ncbi:T6SS immunity protein Tli4 family protein [Pseudoduganella sp.]|uniref:T6SS immunity protein Tli4 family protein n=1 Tax=Pseudoduganella sp. TaxID=1880898 RepID=UPI0035ADDA08